MSNWQVVVSESCQRCIVRDLRFREPCLLLPGLDRHSVSLENRRNRLLIRHVERRSLHCWPHIQLGWQRFFGSIGHCRSALVLHNSEL